MTVRYQRVWLGRIKGFAGWTGRSDPPQLGLGWREVLVHEPLTGRKLHVLEPGCCRSATFTRTEWGQRNPVDLKVPPDLARRVDRHRRWLKRVGARTADALARTCVSELVYQSKEHVS